MGDSLQEIAERLARKPYTITITLDKTTDGDEIYLASTPELAGCMAQGKTRQEAIDELTFARIDYIASLLQDGLPIPEPRTTFTVSMAINVESSKDMAKKNQNEYAPFNYARV